jgi:hypothetical protein
MVMGKSYLFGVQVECRAPILFVTFWSGAAITHPAPGSVGRPSFTSLVGSIDTTAVRYVSTMEVQRPRKELIKTLDSMCVVRAQASMVLGEHNDQLKLLNGSTC